ncbi:MAG: arsenic efflux protein [Clostridia bacterium]|nr:arsenic efflux protein [Clostridia bacterium]
MFLLHIHEHTAEKSLSAFLSEVLLDGFLDTLKIIPFLFLTYLLMEFIEHKASDKTLRFMKNAGNFGPFFGGIFGILPQCAFSAVASNLYTGRVITLGTLFAVFLATSDEMLPILISEGIAPTKILFLLLYKCGGAIVIGFIIDLVMRLLFKKRENINIDEICENDNCHCEKGIFYSATHHTLTVSLFILAVTLAVNTLIFFVGTEKLAEVSLAVPFLSYVLFAIIGLIPGCATSVAITTLGLNGIISTGAMLAGLFANSGVGLIVLWKVNPRKKENLIIMLLLVLIGFLAGILADAVGIKI